MGSATKEKKRKKNKKKQPLSGYTRATADRYELYQLSVQNTEHEVSFLSKAFKKIRGREAVTLREDFCGTALLCDEWVRSNDERTALGIDIDPEPIAWGMEHHHNATGELGKRVTIVEDNVLSVREGNFDIAVAFNFSYWIFEERLQMLRYFEIIKDSLCDDGLFFMDAFGGWEAYEPMEEEREVEGPKGDFTYIWHQAEFNPITNHCRNHIHFHFEDGTRMRKAFSYDWRLWQLRELQELLLEAGFSDVKIYWEDEDDEGEGTGVFRPQVEVSNDPGWLAYIVAVK